LGRLDRSRLRSGPARARGVTAADLQEIAHLIKVLRAMSNVCLGYGSPFPLVAVEKLRTGQAAACERQFPCQIMGVLNACVEPKAMRAFLFEPLPNSTSAAPSGISLAMSAA